MYFEFSKTEKTFACLQCEANQEMDRRSRGHNVALEHRLKERKESQQPQRGEAFKITDLAN